MLLVDVAPDFEHVGDHGEIAVEVRLRTWVRGGRVRHYLGLEFAGQGAEQRLEVVPPRRGSGRMQRQRLEPNLCRKRIEHEARHEQIAGNPTVAETRCSASLPLDCSRARSTSG